MNGRTCLLCGKPLSRIRVGSGEDFCSREHRNQYRLRRGMDRLHEANKVASLMRRRENPKPISTACLGMSPDSRQLYPSFTMPVRKRPEHPWKPKFAAGLQSNIPKAGPKVRHATRHFAGRTRPRMSPSAAVRITGKSNPLALRSMKAKLPTNVSQAPAVTGRHKLRRNGILRKDFRWLRPTGLSIRFDGIYGHIARPDFSRVGGDRKAPRRLVNRTRKGVMLRVSLSVGLRKPILAPHPIHVPGPPALRMAWPKAGKAPEAVDISVPRMHMDFDRGMPTHPVQYRKLRNRRDRLHLPRPDGLPLAGKPRDTGVAIRMFGSGGLHGGEIRGPMIRRGLDASMPKANQARVFALANAPVAGGGSPRSVSVPFVAQDVQFSYSEEEHRRR
jgi:hypothetical protein